MIIIHGENTTKSRAEFAKLISEYKAKNFRVERVEGKKITESDLETLLGSTSLFSEPKLLVIEELHSLPRSSKKNNLIQLLAGAQESNEVAIILWEKRLLTKTMIKAFGNAEVKEFKLSKEVFKFVESLAKKNDKQKILQLLQSAAEQDGEFFVLTMLIRQIRMLIQVKDGINPTGPPFMVSKLKSQASKFSKSNLLKTHSQLLKIDLDQKQSGTLLSLRAELDLCLLSM